MGMLVLRSGHRYLRRIGSGSSRGAAPPGKSRPGALSGMLTGGEEECRDVGEQQGGERDVSNEAAGQDGMVVDAEGEGIAEVGDHRDPGGPPGPALAAAERAGEQDQ